MDKNAHFLIFLPIGVEYFLNLGGGKRFGSKRVTQIDDKNTENEESEACIRKNQSEKAVYNIVTEQICESKTPSSI